ncbi:MAG: hypothetical protein ABI614_04290 [Planctomycetota bacterium]
MSWKPWLISLLAANMIAPLFFVQRGEAQLVFAVALIHGAIFVILTAWAGFSRILGLGHILWFPMIALLWPRLDLVPADTAFGIWLRAVIILDAVSLVFDVSNVARYLGGDRDEMVTGL